MGLSEEQKAERRSMLEEAKISHLYWKTPLSKCGPQGSQLREYMFGPMKNERQLSRGFLFVTSQPGLSQSFARDMVLMNTGVRFAYMSNFVRYNHTDSFSAFKGFVIDWFEQAGMESPFTPRERYELESAILSMIENGLIFYLFSSVEPSKSTWWSEDFMTSFRDKNEILIGGRSGDRQRSERTPISDTKTEGRKSVKRPKGVSIR